MELHPNAKAIRLQGKRRKALSQSVAWTTGDEYARYDIKETDTRLIYAAGLATRENAHAGVTTMLIKTKYDSKYVK
mgnify:CR=1 FL=1